MKIIFSRKGLDQTWGGRPSPIYPPDDVGRRRLYSLPIPHNQPTGPVTYDQINVFGRTAAAVLSDLSPRGCWTGQLAHLDPDLRASAVRRDTDWRPLFGQEGGSLTHLINEGVGVDDVFLFFGWFKQTQDLNGRLVYVTHAPDRHVIFGWLRIGHIWPVGQMSQPQVQLPPYARTHPHAVTNYGRSNAIFEAAGPEGHGGAFAYFDPRLQLTCPAATIRSRWRLPRWFYPWGHSPPRPPLSCHPDREIWTPGEEFVWVQRQGPGQEFVLDTAHYPEAIPWLNDLLTIPTA